MNRRDDPARLRRHRAPEAPEGEGPDEAVVRHGLRSSPLREAGPCPDDNLLAGWAESRLDDVRREAVEAHLGDCDACRAAATELRETTVIEAPPAHATPIVSLAQVRRSRAGAWALAASILVAVGAGIAALSMREPGSDGEGGVDERLVAAARDLREAAPGEFEGFEPAGARERRSIEGDAPRSGVAILRPAAVVLEGRPRFEWTDGVGATEFEVLVAGPDGTELWRRRTTSHALDFPADADALRPGTAYVVEVAPIGGAGSSRATRGVRVASEADAAAWRRAVAEVERRAPADLRDLLLAHLAARRDLLLEASARVDAHVARAGDERVGRETRTWIRRRLGWPDDVPAPAGAR